MTEKRYSSQQIADTICDYVRRVAEIGGLESFEELRVTNSLEGLEFNLRKYELIEPHAGATHDAN